MQLKRTAMASQATSDTDSSDAENVKSQLSALSQAAAGGSKRSVSKKAREIHAENKILQSMGGMLTKKSSKLKHIYRRGKFSAEEDTLLKDLFGQAALQQDLSPEEARNVRGLACLTCYKRSLRITAGFVHPNTNKRRRPENIAADPWLHFS